MEKIVDALLNIEQLAETNLSFIQREKERLPSRIEAETEHVRQRITQETSASLQQLKIDFEDRTAAQILIIEEENFRQMNTLEADFKLHKTTLTENLLEKLKTW